MDWLLSAPPAFRWTVTLAFVAVITLLSIAPGIERPDDSLFGWLVLNTAKPLQKVLHVGVYAFLAMLWMWTLEPVESRWQRVALSLIGTVGLGAVLEWYQTQVPGRYGTLTDILLNLIGAALGILAALLLL